MRAVLPLALAAALSGCDMVSAAVGAVPACHDARVLQSLRDTLAETAAASFAGYRQESKLTELVGELTREPHLVFDAPIDVTPAGAAGRSCLSTSTFDPRPVWDNQYRPADIRYEIFNASDGSGSTARFNSQDVDHVARRISMSARGAAEYAR